MPEDVSDEGNYVKPRGCVAWFLTERVGCQMLRFTLFALGTTITGAGAAFRQRARGASIDNHGRRF